MWDPGPHDQDHTPRTSTTFTTHGGYQGGRATGPAHSAQTACIGADRLHRRSSALRTQPWEPLSKLSAIRRGIRLGVGVWGPPRPGQVASATAVRRGCCHGGACRGAAHQSRRTVTATPPRIAHPSRRPAPSCHPMHRLLRGACLLVDRPSPAKSSCARAQRAGSAQGSVPRAPLASAVTLGGFSHQPDALNSHPHRGNRASTARGDGHFPAKKRRWPAAMTPRGRESVGCEPTMEWLTHRAADGGGPSIEAARTHGRGTSRGAVAGLRAFGPPRLLSGCQ